MIKQQWIDNLETGKYGVTILRDGDNFCVFGILCEMYIRATEKGSWKLYGHPVYVVERERYSHEVYLFVDEDFVNISYPSDNVLNWAGLSEEQMMTIVRLSDEASVKKAIAYIKGLINEHR